MRTFYMILKFLCFTGLLSELAFAQFSPITVPDGGQPTTLSQITDSSSKNHYVFAEVSGKGYYRLNENSWTKGEVFDDSTFIRLIPTDHLLFASHRTKGLYLSDDYGSNFNKVISLDTGETVNAIASDGNSYLIAISNRFNVYISNDKAQSWTKNKLNDSLSCRDIIHIKNH